jgi:hypothetical protein
MITSALTTTIAAKVHADAVRKFRRRGRGASATAVRGYDVHRPLSHATLILMYNEQQYLDARAACSTVVHGVPIFPLSSVLSLPLRESHD